MNIAASGTTGLDVSLDSASSGFSLFVGNPTQWAYLQPNGYVEYVVHAPAAGTYGLAAYYASGTGAGANVLVNGAAQNPLTLSCTGTWDNFVMRMAATMPLP